ADGAAQQGGITIGEALEACARGVGNKAVDHSDAAAIQAAVSPAGLSATAMSAAAFNDGLIGDEGKVKIADILTASHFLFLFLTGFGGATDKLPADRAATMDDADRVMRAEQMNDPQMPVYPGGVAESVASAAGINE
ncbi:hypothetical protein M569_03400, partial [Genlisea aurea]